MCQVLVENASSVSALDKTRCTALHWCVRFAWNRGAYPTDYMLRRDAPAFQRDARLWGWLSDLTSDVYAGCYDRAARMGNAEVARFLVSRGCPLNTQSVTGDTALHWASKAGKATVVRVGSG